MNNGPLPPVPDLIPISSLRKRPPSNNNSDGNSDGGSSECAPCASNRSEVMGEQRPRRRRSANQPAIELIDTTGSRGSSAAPQAPLSRKARPERHRKSDRRRGRRKLTGTRSCSKHSKPREINSSQAPIPQIPRVNPIFVWVRQEDTRIVEVKCEDYDKRNRILLTKTAQGWRAIPRTETLVPTLKEAVRDQHQHHHHHHKNKKSRKGKVRRRSTGVQVSSDIEKDEEEESHPEQQENNSFDNKETANSPSWMSTDNVNVESLLPSHTIKVKRSTSPNHSPERDSNVNSAVSHCAQTSPTIKCSADKICDVSPLDNLLAVAELEFKQQIQSEEWNKTTHSDIMPNEDTIVTFNNFDQTDEDKEFMKNLETLNNLIDSEKSNLEFAKQIGLPEQKSEECDYNDDDDNTLAMDDILSRLEQSLRSPDNTETNNCDIDSHKKNVENTKVHFDSDNETDLKLVPELEKYLKETDPKTEEEQKTENEVDDIKAEIISLIESSTNDDDDDDGANIIDAPTDLSIKINTPCLGESLVCNNVEEEPTDLSVPKSVSSPRPPSQNSEAIQSPQPSGIPAVPQSPDIVSTTVNVSNKPKSVFLESLLTNCTKKMALNSEVTITPQREPLDLGKCRKSASPTVTCSEEFNNSSSSQSEPPTKKIKSVDITLKTLLDANSQKNSSENKKTEKSFTAETSKLLELLQSDSETDPMVQLKQLLSDPSQDIPDPLLVPKDRFSQILIYPGSEIPKLLKERPELRLPQALAYPQIMQDPNMLVISLHHLESILCNKNAVSTSGKSSSDMKIDDKHEKQSDKTSTDTTQHSPNSTKKKSNENAVKTSSPKENQAKAFNELANDINLASHTAFSQLPWFPYVNQLEAAALSNNPDFVKMLTSVHNSLYMNQLPELFASMRPPLSPMGFPIASPINYSNPLEFNMWQEAMLQAQFLRNKSFENLNNEQNMFKNYFEKNNASTNRTTANNCNQRMQSSNKHLSYPNQYYQKEHSSYQNHYGNYSAYSSKSQQNMPSQSSHPRYSMNPKHQGNHFTSKSSSNSSNQINQNFAHVYSQMSDLEKHQYMQNFNFNSQDQFQNMLRKESTNVPHKQKSSSKPFTNSSVAQKLVSNQENHKERNHASGSDTTKLQTTQPIDLSGSTTSGGKLKVKQHLIDPVNTPKLLKQQDDIPEVGSTTASIEEMQDAHKHLWHPLFGNEKGYTSPWNWTTVTATGE